MLAATFASTLVLWGCTVATSTSAANLATAGTPTSVAAWDRDLSADSRLDAGSDWQHDRRIQAWGPRDVLAGDRAGT